MKRQVADPDENAYMYQSIFFLKDASKGFALDQDGGYDP